MLTRRVILRAILAAPVIRNVGWVFRSEYERPEQQGVTGKTFFRVNEYPYFTQVHPGKRLYLNGKDVHSDSFEFDLVGGWVGMFRNNEYGKRARDDEGKAIRIWKLGKIEIL